MFWCNYINNTMQILLSVQKSSSFIDLVQKHKLVELSELYRCFCKAVKSKLQTWGIFAEPVTCSLILLQSCDCRIIFKKL